MAQSKRRLSRSRTKRSTVHFFDVAAQSCGLNNSRVVIGPSLAKCCYDTRMETIYELGQNCSQRRKIEQPLTHFTGILKQILANAGGKAAAKNFNYLYLARIV